MPDIVLKDRSETKHTYEGIEKVQLNTADGGTQIFSAGEVIESIPITLDLREGNQTVEAPEGYLVKSAVIQKPEALKPENIKEGETIAGVEGNLFVPAVVSTTIALDFSEGDMVVTPEDGTTFGEVNIPKPENLTKDNIKHGVRIAEIDGEFIGDTEEKTIDGTNDLTFADGDFVVTPSEETKVISKVTITPPEALRAENIKAGVEIAGVTGTFGELDERLGFFKMVIDMTAKVITLYGVMYDLIYAATGSYDVTIPDHFIGFEDYSVVIAAV